MNNTTPLNGKRLSCLIDGEKGVLKSIKLNGDPLGTEFCANEGNLLYPEMKDNDQWLGDWLLRVWDGNGWRVERTAASGDVRKVASD